MTLKNGVVKNNEFEEYREVLQSEISVGLFKYEIWWKFKNDILTGSKAFQYAEGFYDITSKSLIDSVMWHLSKVIDYHNDSMSICKLLNYLESNCTKIFPAEIQGNIIAHIKEDRILLSNNKETIKNIYGYRDKYLAHPDKTIKGEQQLAIKQFPVTLGEIKSVFEMCLKMINRYSGEYDRSLFDAKIDERDYSNFKECVEKGYNAIMQIPRTP